MVRLMRMASPCEPSHSCRAMREVDSNPGNYTIVRSSRGLSTMIRLISPSSNPL